ncbi:MAG: GspE/PulE family protein [Spirochaeta sp.]
MKKSAYSLQDFQPLPRQQYPSPFIETNGAILLADNGRELQIGITDALNLQLQARLRRYHWSQPDQKEQIRFIPIDPTELTAYLGNCAPDEPGGASPDVEESDHTLLDRLAHDAPIVNLVNSILLEGIRRRASDIHIESGAAAINVRLRIDGKLHTERSLARRLLTGISSRVKVMANLNIMERRMPQDGRCSVTIQDTPLDIRISIVPTIHGESIVLRLLQRDNEVLTIENLGFNPQELTVIRDLVSLPHGLVAVTGPTGSGKSTTLHAMLREIRSDEIKIITIEDPVEFRTPGIDQLQTNEQIGLGFDTILRRILRQDPDIIMVGEIRDKATAELAVRAALTGHLVLTTLHTNDAPSAVTRLIDMGIPSYLLAGVLQGVIAQRLVRRLCPHCRIPAAESSAEHTAFRKLLSEAGLPDTSKPGDPPAGFRAGGCRYCSESGYIGRTALTEILDIDRKAEQWIQQSLSVHEMRENIADRGMSRLVHSAIAAVRSGEISALEAYQKTGGFL